MWISFKYRFHEVIKLHMEFKGIVLNYCHDSRVNTGSSLPSLIKEGRENLSSHIQSKKRAADKINRDDVQASCDTESNLLFVRKLYRSHFFLPATMGCSVSRKCHKNVNWTRESSALLPRLSSVQRCYISLFLNNLW